MNELNLVITITSELGLENKEEFEDAVLERVREMIHNYYWLRGKKFDFTLEGKIIEEGIKW